MVTKRWFPVRKRRHDLQTDLNRRSDLTGSLVRISLKIRSSGSVVVVVVVAIDFLLFDPPLPLVLDLSF